MSIRYIFLACFLAFSTSSFAQFVTISGRVIDERGVGLIGAVVNGRGTQIGTATDLDGNYSLNLPDSVRALVFQYTGYEKREVMRGADTVINVQLQPVAQTLEGVVVTANAVRREKRSLGYSTTRITGDELTSGGNTSPINALVGKAAGVNVTSTANAPGSSSRIVLRGGSSLTGNNQALIVVDGVPVNNSNFGANGNIGQLSNQVDYGNRGNDINPDDIESISVLKGPAATALYGALASNGAVMITTKKGRRSTGPSKTDIEVSSAYELSTILKYPEFQNTYGQGNIYDGISNDRRENFSWGDKFDGLTRPWGQEIDGKQQVKPYSAVEDNVKDFFDIGQTWNNNIGINGGNENAAYRLSLGALNSKSVFPGKMYDRYNLGFNGNTTLSNKLTSSININYVNINSDLPGFGQREASVLDNLYQTPRDIPIPHLRDLSDKFNSMDYIDETGVQRYGYYGAYAINPYYTLEKFKNRNNVDRVYGNIILGYKPVSWLSIDNRLATDNISDRRFQIAPKFNSQPVDPFYTNPQVSNGRYSEDNYNTNNIYNDLMVTFDKNLTSDFNLNVLLGQNYSEYRTRNVFASTNEEGGLIAPDYYNLSNTNGTPLTLNNLSLVRRVGVYTTIAAGYKNMLFGGLNARNDWSSTIKSSYFYYGANMSFVFTELMKGKIKDKVWNYGKFRASYGSVGNDAPPYSDQTVFTRAMADGNFGSTTFPFNGVGAFSYANTLGLPDIQPEFSQEFEIGTENAFLNNRITLDFSYYSKQSRNQIVPVPISPSSGYTARFVNTGLITNNGVELAMRVTVIRMMSGFKWDVFGTYTRNVNEVKEIFAGTDQIVLGGFGGMSIVAATGMPYGTFYTTGEEYTPDGRVIVDSASGIPVVSTTSQYFGSYLPRYQASLGTAMSFKGFSLNLLFDTKQGGVFYSRTRDVTGFVGTSKESEDRDMHVWENSAYLGADGQYHNNTTPYSPYNYFTTAGLRPESANLVDASYVKLREASIGYVMPAKWFKKTFVGGATVSLYGNNLFIWTPASNKYVDPEINSSGASNAQGFDFSAQPSLKRYGINLKFTF